MSEQQADYVTEAVELLRGTSVEIQPARTAIVRENGEFREVEKPAFVKISTSFKSELPNISGDALKVWIFISLSINRRTERANPGLRTIAAGVKLAVNTVQKCLVELEAMNLLSVNRDEARYNIYEIPEYVSANKAEPTVSNGDTPAKTVSNSVETVSNSAKTVSPRVILNQSNQIEPELLSQIETSANKTVDAILQVTLSPKAIQDAMAKHFKMTPKWDGNKTNRQWMQWAMENGVTPEQIETAANRWRSDKQFNWSQPNLNGIQTHWLTLIDRPNESNFERPNVTFDKHGLPESW